MKIPRRISEILARKQAYIDSQRGLMESSVLKLQNRLFSDIISELIPELDIKNGVILDTPKNIRLLSVLDKTYKDFQRLSFQVMSDKIITATSKIAVLSDSYFEIVLTGDLPAVFNRITKATNKLINLKIGLDGGKFTRGGFLQSFFDSNVIGTELKQIVSKAVTSNISSKELIKLLRDKITGVDQSAGLMERQYQRYVYDLYQQYDAAYNKTIGNELGFKYFIYQGGLIRDSRDFCAAHDNKVWSIDETEDWSTWTPSKGDYPSGYKIKQKDIYSVPSYIGYAGYDPLIDRGGYNCRHALGWISDNLAFKLRPELNKLT